MMNNLTEPYARTTYDLKGGLVLSVVTGEGTYSEKDLNGEWYLVEMAIMEKDGDLRYDMTGGDVTTYFPADKVSVFIDWFNANCELEGFFENINGSNRNLPFSFLIEPNRGAIQSFHCIPAKNFDGSMQHRLY